MFEELRQKPKDLVLQPDWPVIPAKLAGAKLTGATFAFDLVQSAASGAYTSSTDSSQPAIIFDTLLDQPGAATITVWPATDPRAWSFATSGTGYISSSVAFIEGGSGSTIAGYTYDLPGSSGCNAVDYGVFWVLQQGNAGGYAIKNTMEMAEHYACNNRSTGVLATQLQLYYR